jgi:hypothetical protein
MRYEGPVRVPAEAAPGKATLRVELDSSTGKKAVPAEFEVTLK